MPLSVTVQRAHTLVDLLLWRAYGRRGCTPAMLAATLDLNRGLAALGSELPIGTRVLLPDLPAAASAPVRKTVNLFGDT